VLPGPRRSLVGRAVRVVSREGEIRATLPGVMRRGDDFHLGHCACFLGLVVYATDNNVDFHIFNKEMVKLTNLQ